MILNKKRKILFLTGSRGEWGYIRPIIKEIEKRTNLSYQICVTNMHLLPGFGQSFDEIKNDKIKISKRILMALDGYTNESMAKSLGVFLMSFVDILQNDKPDLICLAGDRGEQLMAAIAGSHLNIPVAHIQAGELSGNIDGISRHAIARFTHIHFSANKDASLRLLKSGEQKFRIHETGAPQLDDLRKTKVIPKKILEKKFQITKDEKFILLIQHSVTEEFKKAAKQIRETLKALHLLKMKTICIYPNNDAGNSSIRDEVDKVNTSWFTVAKNVPRKTFLGLLKYSSVIVGNSSCGLIEAPFFRVPCVNIGRRQQGRFQGANVLNVPHETKKIMYGIRKAISPQFAKKIRFSESPYGNGRSAAKIVKVISSVSIDNKLLNKELAY